jgi:hypothetical protein
MVEESAMLVDRVSGGKREVDSYTNKSGLWRFEDGDRAGQFVELRVGLKVLNSVSPVRVASGKFRSVPFVSGTGTSGNAIQFVLAKNDNGTSSGFLFDESGVRPLWSDGKAV